MENRIELPQSITNRTPLRCSDSTFGSLAKGMNSGSRGDTCAPLTIAALLTTAPIWKQPQCPWTGESVKKRLVSAFNGMLFTIKKEENLLRKF